MKWRLAAKIVVSAGLILWLLSRTALDEVSAALSALDSKALGGGLAAAFIAWWISAVRLWLLLPGIEFRDVSRMTFVGLYYGTVLPGQVAGDLVKAYRLSSHQSAPGMAAAATFIDRILAILALFAVGTVAAPLVPQAPSQLALALLLITAAMFAGTGVLLLPRTRALLVAWLSRGPATGLLALPGRFASGLDAVMRQPLRLFANIAAALLFHALCVAIQIIVGGPLRIHLSIAAWCLVYAGVSVLMLLPISIAGLGLREGGYVGFLALFGVGSSQALSLSMVLFAYSLIGALFGAVADLTRARTEEC